MKNKNTFRNKLLAIFFIFIFCFSTSSTVFASESNDVNNTTSREMVSVNSVGGLLCSSYGTITGGQGTLIMHLNSANIFANVGITITGNPSEQYYCTIKNISTGASYSLQSVYGNGSKVIAGTIPYASAGDWSVYIRSWNSDTTSIRVSVAMYD